MTRKSDDGFAFSMPNFDWSQFSQAFKVPGLDAEAMLNSQRKNFEAMMAANQRALEGYRQIAERQRDIFQEMIGSVHEAIGTLSSQSKGADLPKAQAHLIEKTVGKALAAMQEMAEMAFTSNSEAFQIIQNRAQEALGELQVLAQKHPGR